MEFVQPIRDAEVVHKIERRLKERKTTPAGWRKYLLFEIGVNTGLRISNMARLRVRDLRGRDVLTMKEKKTGKETMLPINRHLQRVAREELRGLPEDRYIFASAHKTRPTPKHPETAPGAEKPIDRKTAYNYVNAIADDVGIDFRVGCHTLRKTFGYHFYKHTGQIGLLTVWFNHSSENITKRYIGINYDEMAKYAWNFEI
jgi:integrase